MADNFLKLQFYSLATNQAFARDAVAAFCASLNPSLADLSDVKTAVSEAVTNCTVHAYKGTTGIVEIECTVHGKCVHIKVSDQGSGIDDVERAIQPFFTTLPNDERSGMGFTIMQTFMSDFSVKSEVGRGTRIEMKKRIGA
jgi:stage II sporulation protein AB (anti-sigma F factor)